MDKISDYNDFIELYSHNTYDVVLLDFSEDVGKKITNCILDKNAKQRLILLNDTAECFQGKNCFKCKEVYNVDTIIKPIDQSHIARVLTNNIQCESFNKNEVEFKLEQIIQIIVKQYPYVQFNRETSVFSLTISIKPFPISILIVLTSMLDKHTINYHVLDNYNIKII